MPPPPTFEARLIGARLLSLSGGVRELTFERIGPAPAPFVFAAGQWVSLVLPLGEGEARRAYSIASAPNGTPTFEIAVTRVEGGPGSTYLHELPLGGTLRVIGPQGFFTRPLAPQPPSPGALFVGTGTGVTPLRSMIRAALDAGDTAPLTLLFGVRHEEDRLYREELEALVAQHRHFRAVYTISQPKPEWSGLRGYVQTHVEGLWRDLESRSALPPHVYICGLERMVGAVRDLMRKQLGVDRKQVHGERYD